MNRPPHLARQEWGGPGRRRREEDVVHGTCEKTWTVNKERTRVQICADHTPTPVGGGGRACNTTEAGLRTRSPLGPWVGSTAVGPPPPCAVGRDAPDANTGMRRPLVIHLT